jgi:hypothetical protein
VSHELTNPLQSLIAGAAKTLPAETGKTAAYKRRFDGATEAVVILADVSGSMDESAGGKRKIDHLREALEAVCPPLASRDWPVMLAFNSAVRALTSPVEIGSPSGGTALHLAIDEAAKRAPQKTIVISDGQPDDEQAALDAAERLTGLIDVIYCGPEGGAGLAFLRRLARSTGGSVVTCDLKQIGQAQRLVGHVQRLALPAPRSKL